MVHAYHLILSTYGNRLPNDPRGSYSHFVRSYQLSLAGGKATFRETYDAWHAPDTDDRCIDERRRLQISMTRPPVCFTGRQPQAVAAGFADYCRRSECTVHACAILPNHAHLVIRRHRLPIERLCHKLTAAASAALRQRGLHPSTNHPCVNDRLPSPWARKGWWTYLDSRTGVAQAIRYVEANPGEAGLPPQVWRFVQPYGC